jgi:hypothetical protein
MEKPIRKNIRKYPRVQVSLPVLVCTAREDIKAKITNLSLSGAFILLPEFPDLTELVELLIEIPRTRVMVVGARIVRFDMRSIGDGSRHQLGVAVRFSGISNEDRLLISIILLKGFQGMNRDKGLKTSKPLRCART